MPTFRPPQFPLSLKVALWLLLNLVLLASASIGILLFTGGIRPDSILNGPAGRRLETLTDVILAEMRAGGAAEWDAVLRNHGQKNGVEIALFQGAGSRVAGARFDLPDELKASIQAAMPPPMRRGPIGSRSPRILRHTSDPSTWWVILHPARYGPASSMNMVVRVPSLVSLARLLDLHIGLAAGLGAVVLSVLFWLPLVRSITRSLGQLTRATEQFARGRFDARVDDSRRDEIGRLGRAVNRMAGQLDHLVTGQQRFLGDVAHELNSPIGRMQVAVEILDERVPEDLRPAVADVREEVQLMAVLVRELLDFSREQWRAREAVLADIDLAAVAAAMLEHEDPERRVELRVPAGLHVRAEPVLLGRALGNLVRNALRYAGDAGPITLSATRSGQEAIILVEDSGPGVSPEMLPHLGEPFFRGEFARTRESGGVGLGLAIVVRCVRACGGTVQFANRSPKGFVAAIRVATAGA